MIMLAIEAKRHQMLTYAKKYGFTSDKTVQCSQELDKLLNMVQCNSQSKI
nr:aspartyl-phosphate phosphatase Spo0E family protein [Bacillus sp. FJAT-45350]